LGPGAAWSYQGKNQQERLEPWGQSAEPKEFVHADVTFSERMRKSYQIEQENVRAIGGAGNKVAGKSGIVGGKIGRSAVREWWNWQTRMP
jgi:hypothetical protein